MGQAYVRYIDMHAAGLADRDDYKLLRATLTRLGEQICRGQVDTAAARAVDRALVIEIDWESPPEPRELDAMVAKIEAEEQAKLQGHEERAKRDREMLQRHIEAPDAPVPEELREFLELLKGGRPIEDAAGR